MKITVTFSAQWTVSEGGEVNKAIDYSIRAGEVASAVFGYQEAAALWRAALELMPNHLEDPERRAELVERLGELLGLSAPDGEVLQCLEATLKLYQDLDRPHAAARMQDRLPAWLGTRHWASEISPVLDRQRGWRGLAGRVAPAEAASAAAAGRFEEANERLASATEIRHRHLEPFEEAEILHLWGRALLMAGDRAAALKNLDAARDLYRIDGAGKRWLETVQADRLHAQGGQGESFAPAIQEPPAEPSDARRNADADLRGVFRKEGEYWTLSWEGSESRLRHRKGMHYIAWLLRHPGREFAATDLISTIETVSDGPAAAITSAAGAHSSNIAIAHNLGDAGAALDATAKAQYRRRLEDLRDELELAERLNDVGRTENARNEMEFIEAELTAAIGLGGRDRKNGSHAERARLAVTKAIKTALSSVRHADPGLGRHLTLSIQTGSFCSYVPPHPVAWRL
jgi:tetratricopeptide (TPR) repeat protein